MKLTARELATYKWPAMGDCIIFDEVIAGFGLRSRDGRKSWVFQYAIGSGVGRITRRIKIGDYPALSPARAREEAEDLHAKVHLHGDPAIERRKNRADAASTLGKLVERYLEFQQGELRPRSFIEVKRHLGKAATRSVAGFDRSGGGRKAVEHSREGGRDCSQPNALQPFGHICLGNGRRARYVQPCCSHQ